VVIREWRYNCVPIVSCNMFVLRLCTELLKNLTLPAKGPRNDTIPRFWCLPFTKYHHVVWWTLIESNNLHSQVWCWRCRQSSWSCTCCTSRSSTQGDNLTSFSLAAFLFLHFRFELILAKEYWLKCAHKLLVKLTKVSIWPTYERHFSKKVFLRSCTVFTVKIYMEGN
jgi:hypothetical protein